MSAVRRVWLYLLTLIGLGILAAGVRNLLSLVFDLIIRGSTVQVTGNVISRQLSLGLAMLVIGFPLWYFFWRAVQRNVMGSQVEIGSALRKLFLNLVLTVSALIALYSGIDFLSWILAGLPSGSFSPGSPAFLIVMGAVWYYHWLINEKEGQPTPAARTLRRWNIYILSSWGLTSLVLGLIQMITILLRSLPYWGGTFITGPVWNEAVRGSIGMAIVGGVYWAFHWFRMAGKEPDSTLRQVYIYLLAILGSTIGGLVALVVLIDRTLVWLFSGITAPAFFQFLTWTLPTILITIGVWAYHQQVTKEEAGEVREQRLSARRVHAYLMSFVGLSALVTGLILIIGVIIDLLSNTTPTVIGPRWWSDQVSLGTSLIIVASPLWLYYWNRIIDMSASGGIIEWRARSRRVYFYLIIAAAIVALAADLVNIIYQLLNVVLTGSGVNLLRDIRWSLQNLFVAAAVLYYHWIIVKSDQRQGAELAAIHKSVTVMVNPENLALIVLLEEKLAFKVRVLRCTAPPSPTLSETDVAGLVEQISAASGPRIMIIACGGAPIVLPYEE